MKEAPPETRPYRPCVGVVLLNKSNHVFVGSRIDFISDAWQMPQGGIDPGETPLEAARRELLEEIGTNKAELIAEYPEWLTYELPPELVRKLWGSKYRGQKQKWFVFRFTGEDRDINLQTAHPEFRDWKWLRVADLPAAAIDFKKDIYVKLVDFLIQVLTPDPLKESIE